MNDNLSSILSDIAANIQVLGIAGLLGAFTRAFVAPQERWRRRLAQTVVGALSAIFIGPLVAGFLVGFVEKEVYAWLAAGFLCGYGGEAFMSAIQEKVLGGKK